MKLFLFTGIGKIGDQPFCGQNPFIGGLVLFQ